MKLKRTLLRHTLVGIVSAYTYSTYADQTPATRSLETLTVIGNAATEKAEIGGTAIKKLPINIHVVNQDEIKRLRFVDPDELLDRIPGETQVRNLRILNGSKGYTIPMVDGIPLENPYEGATQRIDRVNTSDIQRVEVIKGPASAIYPSNALGGVINVVTRDAPLESETEIWAEAGDFNRARAGINTGGTINKVGYFIDANTRNLDGLRDGVKNDRDQFSAKLIYDPTENTRFITRIEHLKEDIVTRGDLTADEIADDPKQRGNDNSSTDLEQDYISLKLEQQFTSSMLDVSLVYREKDTIGLSRFRGPQDENDQGISSKLLYRYDFDQANIIGGFETYNGEQFTRQFDRNDTNLSGASTRIEGSRRINAYFLQYELAATEQLGISLGVRHERVTVRQHSDDAEDPSGSATFNDTSPKFGITYALTPNTQLWMGLAKGFYAPDIDDIVGMPNEPGTENPELDAEDATWFEIGMRGSAGDWSYDSSYYHNTIKDYLVTQEFRNNSGNAIERTTNAGKVTIEGLESVVEYAPKDAHWRLGITHTYARNKYDSFVSSDGDFSGN